MKNKSKKLVAGIMAGCMALIMILSLVLSVVGPMAGAVSQSEINALEGKKKDLAAKRAEIKGQIAGLQTQQASALEQKAVLDAQNEVLRQEIILIDEQIAIHEDIIAAKAVELEAAKADEKLQYERYRKRMRAMEENGELSYASILFNASSFTDLLSKFDFISEIMDYDNTLEKELIAARENVEAVKAEYEAALAEYEIRKAELEAKKAELEAEIQAAYELIAGLEADIARFAQEDAVNEAAEYQVQKEIDDMIAELRRQEEAARQAALAAQAAAQAAAQSAGGGGGMTSSTSTGSNGYIGAAAAVGATGKYIWPTPASYTITSPFGYRIHPIFKTQKYHSGIDIGAPSGAQILAADSGTVTIAQYSSSYGNYVVINHGDGNTTLYAHQSSMAVSAGQSVSQGQVIGYVGSTGWSTGPHLHYEITQNGERVNPSSFY